MQNKNPYTHEYIQNEIKKLNTDYPDNPIEIFKQTNTTILIYDNYTGLETELFTGDNWKERINDRIFIGNSIKNTITKDSIINIIEAAFRDDIFDAMLTLRGLCIFGSDKDYKQVINEIAKQTDCRINEEYEDDFESYEDLLGKNIYAYQTSMINIQACMNVAKEEAKIDIHYNPLSFKQNYEHELNTAVIQTIIHEIRHNTVDNNLFMPDDKIKPSDESEESVENYCIKRYESLKGEQKHIIHI